MKINEATNIKLENNEIFIGTIETSSIIKIDYVGQNKAKSFLLDGIIEWRDYDNKVNSEEFILELIGQNTSVDWEKLEQIEPYDLEPVTTEDEFIGRKQIINLLKNVKNKLKSSYVFGQRRVGKTSIVKTLQTSLMSEKILVIYFERTIKIRDAKVFKLLAMLYYFFTYFLA